MAELRFEMPVVIKRSGISLAIAQKMLEIFGETVIGVWTNDDNEPNENKSNWDVTLAEDMSIKGEVLRVSPEWQDEEYDGRGLAVGGANSRTYIGGNYYARAVNLIGDGVFTPFAADDGVYNSYIVGWNKNATQQKFRLIVYLDGGFNGFVDFIGTLQWREYVPPEPENPFGDTSTPSDKNGNYDDTSDIININTSTIVTDNGNITVPFPSISASGTGLVSIWKMSAGLLNGLGAKLWSTDFFDNIVKSFLSPLDAVITLNLVPSINNVYTNGQGIIKLGNYDTDITATKVASQFYDIDMGTYTFEEYWGSALDYNPYTTIQIYLPYIGVVDLSPDDVMGKTIHVVYVCDILTGQLCARIYVNIDGTDSLLYTFIGNFSMSVPITGANYSQAYNAIISGTVGLIGGGAKLATGGATSADIAKGTTTLKAAGGEFVSNSSGLASSTVNAMNSGKIQYERGSSMSMTGGYLGASYCYVIITRPKQSLAVDYNKFQGYPSNITSLLSELSGFTAVEQIHLENVPATEAELDEIEALLKEGVII